MKKVIRNIIIVVYATIAIFVTICLLSYNDQKVTELGSYALVIINNNELSSLGYNKGDLAIVDQSEKIEIGDLAFFYNLKAKDFEVSLTEVEGKEQVTEAETTYILKGGSKISEEYVIGSTKNTNRIEKVGTVLSMLESKWGFLILVVLPALLAFLYQIVDMVVEIKKGKKTNRDERA